MKYILSHPRLTTSAELLADKLSELIGEQILVKTRFNGNYNDECIIRYGNSSRILQLYEADLNSPEYIA